MDWRSYSSTIQTLPLSKTQKQTRCSFCSTTCDQNALQEKDDEEAKSAESDASDGASKKAAASMSVQVGSFSDPEILPVDIHPIILLFEYLQGLGTLSGAYALHGE